MAKGRKKSKEASAVGKAVVIVAATGQSPVEYVTEAVQTGDECGFGATEAEAMRQFRDNYADDMHLASDGDAVEIWEISAKKLKSGKVRLGALDIV